MRSRKSRRPRPRPTKSKTSTSMTPTVAPDGADSGTSARPADPRTERVMAHAEALAKAKAAEGHRASTLLQDFVRHAQAAGIPATRLRARSHRGKARYGTNVVGWYLRHDRSVGVSTDGAFYVLTTPASPTARFLGVTLNPTDPPMELGRGARDGESMPLSVALKRRLDAGTDFPS